MFTIKYTKSFEKDFKRCKQRGYEVEALNYGDAIAERFELIGRCHAEDCGGIVFGTQKSQNFMNRNAT